MYRKNNQYLHINNVCNLLKKSNKVTAVIIDSKRINVNVNNKLKLKTKFKKIGIDSIVEMAINIQGKI